jgi:hypothetical protein
VNDTSSTSADGRTASSTTSTNGAELGTPAHAAAIASPGFGTMIRGLGWDIGLPLVAYYALHLAGVGDTPALLAATGIAAVRICWAAVRERSLNPFATVMLVVFGLGLVLSLVSGDARFLLLKNSVVTAAVGCVFLATSVRGKPLTLAAMQGFAPAQAATLREGYRTNPHIRRAGKVTSAVWGLGLLAEAVVRVPLVMMLPISVMVGLGEVLTIATFAILITWNVWYTRRLKARAEAAAA